MSKVSNFFYNVKMLTHPHPLIMTLGIPPEWFDLSGDADG
jgi:hypothetical protein